MLMPDTSIFKLTFITMSPSATPGTAIVFVSPTPSARDDASRVADTDHVSENKPRNWSFPRREVIAVAAAIVKSPKTG
jgi:hypothetical protein